MRARSEPTRPRGRRPGGSDTRAAILTAARECFSEGGFDRTTVRQVAARAGVDQSLVFHFFKTKEQLFVSSIADILDAPTRVPELLAGGARGIGARLVAVFLSVWDEPANQQALVGTLRSVASQTQASRLFRDFITKDVLSPIARGLGKPDADLRASLAGSQLLGLAMARYVLEVEPLASAPAETVIRNVGPTLQRYLAGRLERAT